MPRRLIAILGAAGSVALMAYAGRHNPSRLLLLMFAVWVASPFVLAGRATVAITVGSLAIYAAEAFDVLHVKLGFLFLVVPFASWVAIGGLSAMRRR